jgi:hypothetical protein
MAEGGDRFVEWTLESDRYVMVEIVQTASADGRPHRHLSSPLRDFELTSRLVDAGVSNMDVAELLADARRRALATPRILG